MVDLPLGDYVVLFLDAGDVVMQGSTVVVPTLAAALERVDVTGHDISAAGWMVLRCVARSDDKERW